MPQSAERPELFIIGGPNGSGKSTTARKYVQLNGYPYLCADEIAYELSPNDVAAANIQAGREFLSRCTRYIDERTSVIIETTLSGKGFRRVMSRATAKGYQVIAVFVFVDSADDCILRIAERVRKGGHYVPAEDVKRRFSRSVSNFWNIYRHLADDWIIMYNGSEGFEEIAKGFGDTMLIPLPKLFQVFKAYGGDS